MRRLTITGIAATNGNVEIVTRDHNHEPATITLTPRESATVANGIGAAAQDAGDETPIFVMRNIYAETPVTGGSTNSGNARLDWEHGGFHHRLIVNSGRVREIADLLHDLADGLEDK